MKKTIAHSLAHSFTLALALALSAALALAGCGGNNAAVATTATTTAATAAAEATTAEETTTAAPAPALEPAVITMLLAGDKPPDEQIVLDEIQRRVADTLNITVQTIYTPWSDYQDKHKMMANGGDEFDIFLNFGFDVFPAYTRREAIDATDLLAQYGPEVLAHIGANDLMSGQQTGRQVAIPAVYPKDSVAMTAVLRKDLREKYDLAPVTNWETLSAYYDALVANEPGIIPLASDGSASTTFLLSSSTVPYRSSAYDQFALVWCDEGELQYVVQNRYVMADNQYLRQVGAEAYAKGWFERDLLSQTQGRTLFESGKAASFNVDFYNFTAMEAALKAAVPGAELEWAHMKENRPIGWEKSNNYSQLSSTGKHPERAVMFLNWLLASQENYDLFFFGVEGVHYTLDGEKLKLPDGIDAANNPYSPCPWFLYNTSYHRMSDGESAAALEAYQYFNDATREPITEMQVSFFFNTEEVALETAQCQKVIDEEWYPIAAGVRPDDASYETFLKHLDDAGMPAILENYQKQVDAWLAEFPQ
jgi:putative aldouronate transport system substrate-binding protein